MFDRVLNTPMKGKSPIPPLVNSPELLSATSDKAYLIVEIILENSNLNDSVISLPVFASRKNLRDIFVNSKIVKKVKINLDFSKEADPDCVPVVVQPV